MKKYFILLCITLLGIFLSINSCKHDDKALPVAVFNYSYTNECSIPSEVNFENLSTGASIFRWDFGDGSPVVYENNPQHIYTQEGIYNVELVAYGNGGMHSETKVIYIVTKPNIDYTPSTNDTINANESVNFSGIVLGGVLPSAWFWNFGDGGTSTLQNCTHVYTTPGIYDVTLTAVNACGSTYVEKKKLILVNSLGVPPIANFTANNVTINAGQFVNFTDLSVNSPDIWNWTFPGGSPGNSNIQNPANIQYNTPGYYDVSLTAANAFGSNSLTKTGYIHVLAAAPTMVFIKKITIKQMNFPQTPPYFVNLYFKINDAPPSTVIYLNGMSQIINSVYQSSLPVFWNLSPILQLPVMNHNYQVTLWDRKGMPPQEIPVGFVQFNPSTYTNYPSVITLSQNGINAEVELQWQ